jgi:hypothetical protein
MNIIPVKRDLNKLLFGNQKLSEPERKAVERFGDLLNKVDERNCLVVVFFFNSIVSGRFLKSTQRSVFRRAMHAVTHSFQKVFNLYRTLT